MCPQCEILHLHDSFRSSLQYFHEIDKLRSLVEKGAIRVDSASVPLGEITGNTRGYLRHEFTCSCGTQYAIWLDIADGSGGLCIIK